MEAPLQERHRRDSPTRPCSPPGSRIQPSRPPPLSIAELTDFSCMKQCHDEAKCLIDKGLTADEQGNSHDAQAFYQSGLSKVHMVLAANSERFRCTDEERVSAKLMQQKLNKTKIQIEYRLQFLKETMVPSEPQEMVRATEEPPSYEMATSHPNPMTSVQFAELGDSIMAEDMADVETLTTNATEIFSIPDGVQTFFITSEGYVSAPSYPSALKIFKFDDHQSLSSDSDHPQAFLTVGDWLYPLQPGTSPVLQSCFGAYMFPDTMSSIPGSSVGLMIPDTVCPAQRHELESLLQSLTILRLQEATPTDTLEAGQDIEQISEPQGAEGGVESTSSKISKGLISAADYISWGVGKGAEKAGTLIKLGSEKLRNRLQPEDKPKEIDPKLRKGIQYVRVGSHAAVKVSSFIVSKLGQATMALAREAAPHIRHQGQKFIPKSMKNKVSSPYGKSKLDGAVEVAASGLKGFGTVYCSLETAAKALGKSLANETVNVVGHKYGTDAGQFTEHTLYSAGNIAMTAYNANNFGVKAVAKRAAKDTGKAVLEDLSKKNKQEPGPNHKPPSPH